ncbi:MAG: CDP-diacylglycerol--serine O-phosphatidyltransferase [Acidobacteria bacterium]|nr:CDP-diacylglycerol--serine O-phosphatidyltransferase [Acidobacteriota bacterium]
MPNRYTELPKVQAIRLRRNWRKGVFVLPSLITTANIFCGFYSIMESLAGGQAFSLGDTVLAAERFNRAAMSIGFAALFDLLDGRIARLTNTTSEFGIELDSIADVVSFGVAPAVLAYIWGYGHISQINKLAWAASFLFLICGALRLARFNVQARQPNPNLPPKNPKEKKAFVGMPIPAGAYLIAAIVHFSPLPISADTGYIIPLSLNAPLIIPGRGFATVLLALVGGLALLMVSTFRYSSLNKIGSGKQSPRVVILGFALLGLVIWFYSTWSLLALSLLYASHGVIAKLWSLVKPRRSLSSDVELSHHS